MVKYSFLLIKKATVSQTTIGIRSLFHIFAPAFLFSEQTSFFQAGLMEKKNAVITGVGGYVPDYILTNDEISKMVDTTDEWIMGRIGIKERHILKEEGLGTSYIARKAVKQLIERTQTNPDDIDLIIVATTTPDYRLLFYVKDWS